MSHVIAAPAVDTRPRRLAHVPADRLDPVVRELVEHAATEAHRQGHDAGLREGLAAASAHADRLAATLVEALDRTAMAATAARDGHVQEALDLALAIAETVVGREPHDAGQAVAGHVREVLDQLVDPTPTVHVHPDDQPLVASALVDRDVTVVGDPGLQPGDARVQGGWAEVDMTRRTAWAAVREALDGA